MRQPQPQCSLRNYTFRCSFLHNRNSSRISQWQMETDLHLALKYEHQTGAIFCACLFLWRCLFWQNPAVVCALQHVLEELSKRPTLDSVIGLCESWSTVQFQRDVTRLQGAQDKQCEQHKETVDRLTKRISELEESIVVLQSAGNEERFSSLDQRLIAVRKELEDVARLLQRKLQALALRFNEKSITQVGFSGKRHKHQTMPIGVSNCQLYGVWWLPTWCTSKWTW